MNNFGIVYQDQGDNAKAIEYYTRSLLKNEECGDKNGEANTLSNIGRIYSDLGDIAKSIDYHSRSLKIRETIGDKRGISIAYSNIASIYCDQGNYPKSLDYYFKGLEMDEAMGGKHMIAVALTNIGIVYSVKADYPKALLYFYKALKIAEEIEDKQLQANDLKRIGNVHNDQGDYPKAIDYQFKALRMMEQIGDKKGISKVLNSIGIVYHEQGNYPKALEYHFKALEMDEEMGYKNGISIGLSNIGDVYCDQSNYQKALKYYIKSLKMNEELGNKNAIGASFGNIGSLYTETGKFKKAEQYLKRAIAIEDSIGAIGDSRIFEESLSHLYDTIGSYKLALIHYKKAMILKDTIFSQENKKQLIRKEMNYEFDKKEAITKAENEKQEFVAEEKNRKQKIITWSIAFGLLFVIVFAGFIFRSLRITRKQKQIIEVKSKETEEQKKIVEKKNILVEEKQKEILDSINYAKRIQRAMLPHRRDIWAAFPESFVLFKPKDIVSGDFYFFHKNNQSAFIATADCTGHGVPGAFMSMIGAGKLNDAVSESSDTSEVLSLLNKGIKTALKQTDGDESTRDGMDIALCYIDTENHIIKYAGANRPLWIIRNGKTNVEEIKATKTAIGGLTEDTQYFDTHELKLQQGDTFYICTDGYADQFGGQTGKKLMTKKFKEILLSIQSKPMKEQEQHLDNFIENWKAGIEQVDDILVIGVRL